MHDSAAPPSATECWQSQRARQAHLSGRSRIMLTVLMPRDLASWMMYCMDAGQTVAVEQREYQQQGELRLDQLTEVGASRGAAAAAAAAAAGGEAGEGGRQAGSRSRQNVAIFSWSSPAPHCWWRRSAPACLPPPAPQTPPTGAPRWAGCSRGRLGAGRRLLLECGKRLHASVATELHSCARRPQMRVLKAVPHPAPAPT